MVIIGVHPMNGTQKQKHSLLGIELLRELANQGYRIFSIKEARKAASRLGTKCTGHTFLTALSAVSN